MSTTLSRNCKPSIESNFSAVKVVAPFNCVAASGNRVRLIKVDLPEPETPVTQVITPKGIVKSTFCKLCPDAPISLICSSGLGGLTRSLGTAIFNLPERYFPVKEFSLAASSS